MINNKFSKIIVNNALSTPSILWYLLIGLLAILGIISFQIGIYAVLFGFLYMFFVTAYHILKGE